ncbi:MAG TPA: hypothetical protein VGY99_25350 [Candidatus Binataceae bacterium]|jgi:hypothetical protein|nr:hypothetical protein [Candidatus Binataceae bacterium]
MDGRAGSGVALLALVVINISHTEPKQYLTFDDEYFYPESIAVNGINTTTREEYEPRWVVERPAYSPRPLWADDAKAAVRSRLMTSNAQSFEVSATGPARMYDALFYYPGWTAEVDGREVAVSPAPLTGLITFDVPAGTHNVALRLRPTPLRALARDISLGAIVFWALMLITGAATQRGMVRERLPRFFHRSPAVGTASYSKRIG